MAPFTDDLDGREADLAITFGIDGILYRVRLSTEHACDLYDLLAPLRDHAGRVGVVNVPEPEIPIPAVEFENLAAYWRAGRDWARARGIDLPLNRQPPRAVMAAFALERGLEERDHHDATSPPQYWSQFADHCRRSDQAGLRVAKRAARSVALEASL